MAALYILSAEKEYENGARPVLTPHGE